MIAPSRGAAYRRFYLYSALSVAVIAIAVGSGILVRLGLQSFGFGARPTAVDVSRNISLAASLLGIALPVGLAHLWLILRSFTDPAERAAGVRHQYLNLWIAFALAVILFAGQAAFSALTFDDRADVTIQVSIVLVAAAVGAAAAWWIGRTPPAIAASRIRAAVVVMLVAMAVAAFALAGAATNAGTVLATLPQPSFNINIYSAGAGSRLLTFDEFQERQIGASLLTAGLALTVWSLGFAWQRRWAESRDRFGYALVGYGIGTVALLVGGAFAVATGIRVAQDGGERGAFTATWPFVAAGALLFATHLAFLLRDRGHNGHPAGTTTRLLLAFPAVVGIGMAVGGLGLGWHAALERDEVTARHLTDDLLLAGALAAIGVAAYVPSWLGLDRRSDATSAVRRFYLFTIVCLALVAGLVSAVVVLYESITAAAGSGDALAGRTAVTWLVPLIALVLIFVGHGRLLLRDQRSTRTAEVAVATDPLLALLEEVRAGRVTSEQAAATIRGGVS